MRTWSRWRPTTGSRSATAPCPSPTRWKRSASGWSGCPGRCRKPAPCRSACTTGWRSGCSSTRWAGWRRTWTGGCSGGPSCGTGPARGRYSTPSSELPAATRWSGSGRDKTWPWPRDSSPTSRPGWGRCSPHDAYASQLTDLRDRLRASLSDKPADAPACGPTASDLAEQIQHLRASYTIQDAPTRPRPAARPVRPVVAAKPRESKPLGAEGGVPPADDTPPVSEPPPPAAGWRERAGRTAGRQPGLF